MPTPTKIQTAHNSGTATSLSVTLNGVTAGNLVWFGLITGGTAAPTSVTDSNGTPSLVVNTSYTLFGNGAQYIVPNAASGTHTLTANFAVSTSCLLFIAEYSNIATSSVVDGTPGQKSASSGTTLTTTSTTASVANDLVIVLAGTSGASNTFSSWLNGVTQEDILNPGPSGAWADLVDTGTGAISSGCTAAVSHNWSCSIALYKAGSGGGGGSTPQPQLMMLGMGS